MKREKQRTTVFKLIDLLPLHCDERHNAKKRPEAEVAVHGLHCLSESEKTEKKGEFGEDTQTCATVSSFGMRGRMWKGEKSLFFIKLGLTMKSEKLSSKKTGRFCYVKKT